MRFFVVFLMLMATAAAAAKMIVNGRPVPDSIAKDLTNQFNVPATGSYWYDPRSGLLGFWGGPPQTQIPMGLATLGPLPGNASANQARLRINGRGISFYELFALEYTYTLLVEGDYVMGPDLGMQKTYAGAPVFKYGEAMAIYNRFLVQEARWCEQARRAVRQRGPGAPVLLPNRSGGFSVQVTMDSNGCVIAQAQGYFVSRCC